MSNLFGKYDYQYFFGAAENFSFGKLYLVFYLAVIFLAVGSIFFFRYRLKKNAVTRSFIKKVFWGNLVLGLVGLFLIFSRDQDLPIFSMRVLGFLNIALFISYNIYLFVHFKRILTKKLFEEKNRERIEKWLPKKKKKKR